MNSNRRKFIKSLFCLASTLPFLRYLKTPKKDSCHGKWSFESGELSNSFDGVFDEVYMLNEPLSTDFFKGEGTIPVRKDFSVHAWIQTDGSAWQEIKTTVDKWNETMVGFDGVIDGITVSKA